MAIESVIQLRRGPSTQQILDRDRNPPPAVLRPGSCPTRR